MARPGTFQPGQSGNPGGRPKSNVVAMARQHTQEAVDALVTALRNPRERVSAAVALLDRGWGKPVQMVAGDPERPIAIDFSWAPAQNAAPTIDAESTALQVVWKAVDTSEDTEK